MNASNALYRFFIPSLCRGRGSLPLFLQMAWRESKWQQAWALSPARSMGIETPPKMPTWGAFRIQCMKIAVSFCHPQYSIFACLCASHSCRLRAAIFHALLILKNDLHKTLDTPFDGKGHQRLQSWFACIISYNPLCWKIVCYLCEALWLLGLNISLIS